MVKRRLESRNSRQLGKSWPVILEDVNAPAGTYAIDQFLGCFIRNPAPELCRLCELLKLKEERSLVSTHQRELAELGEAYQQQLVVFRHDVIRLVRRVRLRVERDNTELPEARRQVAELLDGLSRIEPALGELVGLTDRISERGRAPFDAAVAAAKSSPVLRRKLSNSPGGTDNPDPHTTVSYLVQILEQLRGLYEWVDEFLAKFEPISPPRNVRYLPKHLAGLGIAFHHQWLGEWPPANRLNWLADFLAVVCLQFKLPIPQQDEVDLASYLGGKIEEAVARDVPGLK